LRCVAPPAPTNNNKREQQTKQTLGRSQRPPAAIISRRELDAASTLPPANIRKIRRRTADDDFHARGASLFSPIDRWRDSGDALESRSRLRFGR
jgi:hypothetical protein